MKGQKMAESGQESLGQGEGAAGGISPVCKENTSRVRGNICVKRPPAQGPGRPRPGTTRMAGRGSRWRTTDLVADRWCQTDLLGEWVGARWCQTDLLGEWVGAECQRSALLDVEDSSDDARSMGRKLLLTLITKQLKITLLVWYIIYTTYIWCVIFRSGGVH